MIYKTVMRAYCTRIGSFLLLCGFCCRRLIVLSHCIVTYDLSHLHIQGYQNNVHGDLACLSSIQFCESTRSRSRGNHPGFKQVNLISIVRKSNQSVKISLSIWQDSGIICRPGSRSQLAIGLAPCFSEFHTVWLKLSKNGSLYQGVMLGSLATVFLLRWHHAMCYKEKRAGCYSAHGRSLYREIHAMGLMA